MATMLDGESYLGRVMVRPLSESKEVTLYLWPMRCLRTKIGGPTFGVDVRGTEIIRFDPHGPRGHWHQGGYDKLGAGGSHVDYPEGMVESKDQLAWSLDQLREQTKTLLTDAGYADEAASVDQQMVDDTIEAIKSHLEQEGNLFPRAIEDGLIAA